MSLDKYKEKRNFSSTLEPKANENDKSASNKEALRFVIQKHNASRLHYDLRLEVNGVLKSWAVPKGPSLNPRDKRLAMMVEDHPLEYQNFEGKIPKGNYGAGEVIIWDRGYYSSTEDPSAERTEKSMEEGINKGHLAFVLYGDKIKGLFDLIKIKTDEEGKSWLLIKRPDDYISTKNILLKNKSVVSGKTIEDLRSEKENIDWKTKVILDSIPATKDPEKINPMVASSTDQPFNKKDWIFEIKWDGYRGVTHTGTNFKFYSRNHKSFIGKYPEIENELRRIENKMIIDGEITAIDEKGNPIFQLLQDYAENPRGVLMYYVFDILFYEGKNLTELSLNQRKNILKQVLPQLNRVKYTDHIEEDGTKFFNLVTETGLEGIIAKNYESKYKEGVRSSEWLKIKKMKTQEAIICGYTEPKGGRGYIGAVILGVFNRKNELLYIGHTGGGFNDDELKDLFKKLKELETNKSPFNEVPETNSKVHWVKPEIICEVEFSNWTQDGHLRHPVFLRFRRDKNIREITIEKVEPEKFFKPEIKEIEYIEVDSKKIQLTNASKIYWEKEGYTKRDLFEYYEKISAHILPYLLNRPESLLRHPNGIFGESFYQKNIEDVPKWIKTKKIKSDTENRDINYLICNDLPTLLYMVNLGCIEINPWNSSLSSLEKPDYMVIDLDPGEIDFKYVVRTARETKKILDHFGINSWCKTSGKTGLHIYVPMGAIHSYEQVRNFCELLVRLIHKTTSNFTSLERNPLQRKNKVYLDYLQNRMGQTLSAPYCVRPTPGAPVSTPLNWDEVNEKLDPNNFNIRTIFKRLENVGDLWNGVLGIGVNLEQFLKQVEYEQK